MRLWRFSFLFSLAFSPWRWRFSHSLSSQWKWWTREQTRKTSNLNRSGTPASTGTIHLLCFLFLARRKRIESILSIILTVDYQSTSVDGFADSFKKILSVNHVSLIFLVSKPTDRKRKKERRKDNSCTPPERNKINSLFFLSWARLISVTLHNKDFLSRSHSSSRLNMQNSFTLTFLFCSKVQQ